MYLVLGSLGRIKRLSQLLVWPAQPKARRRQIIGWSGLFMRHLEGATLSAREGERVLEAEEDDSLSEELDDVEIWLGIIHEQDAELVRLLSDDALAITFHGYDYLIQIIWPESLGKAIAGDKKRVKLMEDAARILHEDAEVNITWVPQTLG